MNDIRLDSNWDLYIDKYDIQQTDSLAQQINIRLKWFFEEWVFRLEFGVDYFGKIFVKNPNNQKIISMLTDVIMSVEGVTDVPSIDIELNRKTREATIRYEATTNEETLRKEVEIWLTA